MKEFRSSIFWVAGFNLDCRVQLRFRIWSSGLIYGVRVEGPGLLDEI